jgi:hypothetical protein
VTPFFRTIVAAAAACSLGAFSALPAPAAGGISYGSVMKFSVGSGDDGSAPPAPGTYRTDFETAANPAPAGDSPHMPFGLGKMMAKAQSAMAMFKNGTAEKHYVGTTRERVDNVALQTADITDCTARTITHLDLAKKTYSVESLDHPETPMPSSPGRHSEPGAMPTDDGTKIAIDVANRALGALTVEGVPTNGYETKIKMTATRPTGESSSTTMVMTAYYSGMEEPHFSCGPGLDAFHGAPPDGAAAAMANYMLVMKALKTPKGDSRFTFTSSGPALPSSKLAMWQSMTMGGGDARGSHGGGSFAILTERGDVHAPVSDADPVFGIPAGFTKVNA